MIKNVRVAQAEIAKLRTQLQSLKQMAGEGALAYEIDALEKKASALDGEASGGRRGGEPSLGRLAGDLFTIMRIVEGADALPTSQVIAAYDESQKSVSDLLGRWNEIKSRDVDGLNERLRRANLPPLKF